MAYTMLISYFENGKGRTFDVSQIVHNIEYTTSLDSQPGKLTFMLEKDTSNSLKVGLGSPVQFFSNGKAIFYGKVFAVETDLSDVYKVTAYDPLRYFKNCDSVLVDETYQNIGVLFDKILKAYNLQGRLGGWADQVNLQPLEEHNFSNCTLFEILDYYMTIEDERMTKSLASNQVYGSSSDENALTRLYLRCNYNKIELREVRYDFLYDEEANDLKDTALLIGDESLMTDYEYKIDIDDTYNRLIFVYNKEDDTSTTSDDTNTQVTEKQMFAAMDSGHIITNTGTELDGKSIGEDTISRWGVLSKIIELEDVKSTSLVAQYMKACMEVYSQPNRTLKINAMGHDSIFAGDGFYLHLSKLDVNYPVYVISATHRYEADEHMMELEVATSARLRKFL